MFLLAVRGERERERMVALSVFGALWKVFKSGLLATNAVTILHRQRFLRKCERGKCVEFNTGNTYITPQSLFPEWWVFW